MLAKNVLQENSYKVNEIVQLCMFSATAAGVCVLLFLLYSSYKCVHIVTTLFYIPLLGSIKKLDTFRYYV